MSRVWLYQKGRVTNAILFYAFFLELCLSVIVFSLTELKELKELSWAFCFFIFILSQHILLFLFIVHVPPAFVSLLLNVDFDFSVSVSTGLMRMSFIEFMLLQVVTSQEWYHRWRRQFIGGRLMVFFHNKNLRLGHALYFGTVMMWS